MFSASTVFTPAQQYILGMMSQIKTDNELDELKQVISDYYARKVDEEMDKLWEEGIINNQKIEGWLSEHLRTPYRT